MKKLAISRSVVVSTALLLLTSGIAVAQSSFVIDSILQEKRLTFGNAAYLAVLSASPEAPELDREAAVSHVAELFPSVSDRDAQATATFGEFAFLLMKAHDVPGGVMYSLLPSPRYAAREAVYREWTSRSRAPGSSISGQEALQILNRFLIWKEENL